tara:strand:- start:6735 stop:7886 length:1152 start_codon:yes stop_codon:yes gene_type:complete
MNIDKEAISKGTTLDNVVNDIAESGKTYITDTIRNMYKKKQPKYSIKNLENKLDKFFKKEKRFFKNKLLIYYNFKKSFYDIPTIPYFVSLFYSNVYYIISSVINSPWEEILDIYEKVQQKHPNYRNSRLSDNKPAYDRRFLLIIVYYIFLIFIYTLSNMLYKLISTGFNYIINIFDISHDANATFALFIIYTYFILGCYYGGIPFMIKTIILLARLIYFICIVLYYIIYFILYALYILFSTLGKITYNTGKAIIGGKKSFKGGSILDTLDTIIEDFNLYINNLKKTFDNLTIEFFSTLFDKSINYITPDADILLNNECASTSNIERMLARHNNSRNTEEPININEKVNETIKNALPSFIGNNDFVKCMYKPKPKKPPPKCDTL